MGFGSMNTGVDMGNVTAIVGGVLIMMAASNPMGFVIMGASVPVVFVSAFIVDNLADFRDHIRHMRIEKQEDVGRLAEEEREREKEPKIRNGKVGQGKLSWPKKCSRQE